MDPVSIFGIATGVVGLLPICASGCTFIVGLCKAHGNVQEQMIRVRMQRGVCLILELPFCKFHLTINRY